MIYFKGRIHKICWYSGIGNGKKRKKSQALLKFFGLKTEKIEVQFIEMRKVAGEADLLKDGEVNFEQVNLSSRQIYQIDLKSGVYKNLDWV